MKYVHRYANVILCLFLMAFGLSTLYHAGEYYLVSQNAAAVDPMIFTVKVISVISGIGSAYFLVRWCCVMGFVFCVRNYPGQPFDFFMGRPEVLVKHLVVNTNFEFIKYAAIKHPNGCVFAVSAPGRHGDVMFFMHHLGMAGINNTMEQGFVTSFGRFVDREQALQIAQDRRQIVRKHPAEHELYSEDLWPETAPA